MINFCILFGITEKNKKKQLGITKSIGNKIKISKLFYIFMNFIKNNITIISIISGLLIISIIGFMFFRNKQTETFPAEFWEYKRQQRQRQQLQQQQHQPPHHHQQQQQRRLQSIYNDSMYKDDDKDDDKENIMDFMF
jgi:uncharacterized membrane protein YraQ (UPF0718 family)